MKKRTISFKLLSQLEPVTIESNAESIAQLTSEISNDETLSKLIEVTPTTNGTSKTYITLVDGTTSKEYTFDKPADTLPERDILFYVTPVTSKFGADNDELIIHTGSLEITVKVISRNGVKEVDEIKDIKESTKKNNTTKTRFTKKELTEIDKKAKDLFIELNRKVNNLPV